MAKKTTAKAAPKFYAQSNTAIDGKHFAQGQAITDVDTDQLALAVRLGAAGPDKPRAKAAPEIDAPADEPETGEGAELTGEGEPVAEVSDEAAD